MTTLHHFWPSQENIADCIRTEAEVVDDAVLLAVHEPGPLIARSANGAVIREATERDLLDSLMRDASDGSAVVVAITGDSGVGKSHMVRWLHAQLQRHPQSDSLVIVLVPKTASLRQVVERILAPLQGKAYERLLSELDQAVDHLKPHNAAQMLATALSIELGERFETEMEALRQADRGDRSMRERLALTKTLRDLVREPDVFDGWFGPLLERIVRQTLEGGSELEKGELRRFVPKDLITPEGWSPDGNRRPIVTALQQLTKSDGANRPLAADILQESLDPALRSVFQFSKALGQRTIEDIVDDIRRRLLDDGKELVLLIEDFAALAGIQQPLLNLMIAESDHGGKRIRAPIRTALAVTDGFLPSRQTILTRAKQEWLIPNTDHTEGAIVSRLTDLAGRYLNAARWGLEALREQFQQNKGDDLESWVVPYPMELTDEDDVTLRAFSTSRQGVPLFPLSRIAIDAICRRELKVGGELRYNPRTFINSVLRETLNLRPLFESRAFPPANFKGAAPHASVQLALAARGWPEEQRERLAPVMDYWAGNPSSLSDPPSVDRGVFDGFGLPWPFQVESGPGPDLPPGPVPDPEPRPSVLPAPTPSTFGYLEEWAKGGIAQTNARRVRKLLANALERRLDWPTFRMKGRTVEAEHLWLPFARTGNPTNEPKFLVASETRPLDPVLLAGVAALERWEAQGKTWDYPKSEDDYPIAQQLLDRIEAQALSWHAAAAESLASVLLRVLHRQALLLRLSRSAEPRHPALSSYFTTLDTPLWSPDPSDNSPAALVARAAERAESARLPLGTALGESVGCFQGVGKTLLAVDPMRIKAAWRQELPEAGAMLLKADTEQTRPAADDMLSRSEALLQRFKSAVEPHLPSIKDKLGDSAETNIGAVLQERLEQAQKTGLFALITSGYADTKRALESISSDDAKTLIRRVLTFEPPTPDASLESRLAGWSKLELRPLLEVSTALAHLETTLGELERAASAQIETLGGGDVGVMLTDLQNDLEQIVEEESK